MTASLEHAATRARGAGLSPARALTARERVRVLAWLDRGLRRGELGRLAAEYPLALTARELRGHRAVFAGRRPVAHALWRELALRAGARSARIALIGSVYTAPEQRGRGLARRCIHACLEAAHASGCALALLWGDARYYARLGFAPAGRERRIALRSDVLLRALSAQAPPGGLRVEPASAADAPALSALFAGKAVASARPPGAFARLLRTPELTLVVARDAARRPVAYAACGKGDDLRGVVHEWAGDALGVLACVAQLHVGAGASQLLASALEEPASAALLAAGADVTEHPLALARPLCASEAELTSVLSWLYVWGFDSL